MPPASPSPGVPRTISQQFPGSKEVSFLLFLALPDGSSHRIPVFQSPPTNGSASPRVAKCPHCEHIASLCGYDGQLAANINKHIRSKHAGMASVKSSRKVGHRVNPNKPGVRPRKRSKGSFKAKAAGNASAPITPEKLPDASLGLAAEPGSQGSGENLEIALDEGGKQAIGLELAKLQPLKEPLELLNTSVQSYGLQCVGIVVEDPSFDSAMDDSGMYMLFQDVMEESGSWWTT